MSVTANGTNMEYTAKLLKAMSQFIGALESLSLVIKGSAFLGISLAERKSIYISPELAPFIAGLFWWLLLCRPSIQGARATETGMDEDEDAEAMIDLYVYRLDMIS